MSSPAYIVLTSLVLVLTSIHERMWVFDPAFFVFLHTSSRRRLPVLVGFIFFPSNLFMIAQKFQQKISTQSDSLSITKPSLLASYIMLVREMLLFFTFLIQSGNTAWFCLVVIMPVHNPLSLVMLFRLLLNHSCTFTQTGNSVIHYSVSDQFFFLFPPSLPTECNFIISASL